MLTNIEENIKAIQNILDENPPNSGNRLFTENFGSPLITRSNARAIYRVYRNLGKCGDNTVAIYENEIDAEKHCELGNNVVKEFDKLHTDFYKESKIGLEKYCKENNVISIPYNKVNVELGENLIKRKKELYKELYKYDPQFGEVYENIDGYDAYFFIETHQIYTNFEEYQNSEKGYLK